MRRILLALALLLVPVAAACGPDAPQWTPVDYAIHTHFGPLGQVDEAYRVAWCESKYDPNTYYQGHAGLFQISLRWHTWRFNGEDPYDPMANARVAAEIYREQGWRPWECKPNG